MLTRFRNVIDRRRRGGVPVWYDRAYRMPLPGIEGSSGMEPRRSDYVVWYLADAWALPLEALHPPSRIGYADLARVHTPGYLESLTRPETIARIFSIDPAEVRVDEVMKTLRLACGGTLSATHEALRRKGPTMNLLGGFHHAAPDRGGGFCAVNDIAVAVAALRAKGFLGRVAVLDLDAHPPDGTAECLANDRAAWIGSISGSDWGPLDKVDETLLPCGAGDREYLAALEKLLRRMPKAHLAFVLAGGDVLAGDRFGQLGLSLPGVRARDRKVGKVLAGVPTVWLPAGGYHRDSWRALAGTYLAVALGSKREVPADYDPLRARFSRIFRQLRAEDLEGEADLTLDDLEEALGISRGKRRRLLGFYTAEGIEYALYRYGVLDQLQRLGYDRFRVLFEPHTGGDRIRLLGQAGGQELVLIEAVLGKKQVGGLDALFVNWLTLRNPLAQFSPIRPQLPGQEFPGLGLAREAVEMIARIARRLGLGGVAIRPAHYHVAYACRHRFRFADPERQGRFEAMVRDLHHLPLLEATRLVAEERVLLNEKPYTWEADDMVFRLEGEYQDRREVAEVRDRSRFTLLPARDAPPGPGPDPAPAADRRTGAS